MFSGLVACSRASGFLPGLPASGFPDFLAISVIMPSRKRDFTSQPRLLLRYSRTESFAFYYFQLDAGLRASLAVLVT